MRVQVAWIPLPVTALCQQARDRRLARIGGTADPEEMREITCDGRCIGENHARSVFVPWTACQDCRSGGLCSVPIRCRSMVAARSRDNHPHLDAVWPWPGAVD